MYHGGESKKKINPKENANLLSLITFFYTRKLFSKGFKHDIEEQDIYQVIPNFASGRLGDELERKYMIEKATHDEPSILRLLWACYGKYYAFLGLLQLIMRMTIVMLQPVALGRLVSYFAPGSKLTQSDAIYYASVLIAIIAINAVYSHNYQLALTEFAMRVRVAFCSLIYRKSLKLSAASLSEITIGKVMTLISKDVNSFDTAILFFNDIWIGLIQMVVIGCMIYSKLGLATTSAIIFVTMVIFLQIGVGKYTSITRVKASKVTDERLQVTQEALSAIKIIKMYSWEKFFGDKISTARQNEIGKIKKIYVSKAVALVIGSLVTKIALFLLIMTYIWMGNHLTAELVFYVLSCLNSLRSVITISIPLGIAQSAELLASIKRMNKVLKAPEVQKPKRNNFTTVPVIRLEKVAVKIDQKLILNQISLKIDSGFNLITGRVGYGKSSLLKTILEDYPICEGYLNVQGSISYACEEPWVFPSSIKQNIVFGQPYNEERYRTVLEICALTWDISVLEKGDNTIVGDRGLNLSKGQQARINLARALYKDSQIYLLDDCLSSLDANVQDYVFRESIKKFLKNKIVLLVSHSQNHLKEADNVIIMEGGTVVSCAKPSEIPEEDIGKIVGVVEASPDIIDNIDIETEKEKVEEEIGEETELISKEKLGNIYHEDKKLGKVEMKVYKKYYHFGGGIPIAFLIFVVFVVAQIATSYTEKLVSNWANIEQNLSDYHAKNLTHTPEYHQRLRDHAKLLKIYSIMLVLSTILVLARAIAHFNFSSKASVNLHKFMITSIINGVMEFFDRHYIGNILNRLSKDLGTIDEFLPFITYECMRLVCLLVGIIVLIASVNYIFLIPATLFFVGLAFVRRYYIPTGRSLKRLDSATRSPVIGHLNSSLEGLTTIRAYGTQKILESEFDKHQDLSTSASHMLQLSSRAFGFLLEILCSLFITTIITRFVAFKTDAHAGNVGLAITQAYMLTGLLQWGIRQWAELENQMTSVERVLEYTDIESETKTGRIIPNWPENGEIVYKNVSLTYSNSKKRVLKDINFTINPREKIGVVGRTGAGKSSIVATLFRLYDSEGVISIDGVDIKSLSLDFLRSTIAIIPQDPVLFTGNIRSNIDPTGKYSDDEIWKAVETVKLKGSIENLDETITEGGSNFSSGQRQLICLARATITKNKIIVLDEATANMDPETDNLIHNTIQENFADCTVLTVAHRLHTVLGSDRVMVVDKGRIVEFDQPSVLLEDKKGLFYQMVKQANLLNQ